MEELHGTAFQKLVGQGTRVDPDTGKSEPVSYFYPNSHAAILRMFERYPIPKYFGISVSDALNMPLDQWHRIRKAAESLPDHRTENEMLALSLKRVLDISMAQALTDITGGGGAS